MGVIGMFLVGTFVILVLAVSTVFLLRERLLRLAAYSAGVLEYDAEQLTWRGCKRLRLVLRKGPVRCVQLESFEVLQSPSGWSATRALWLLWRLAIAAARGGDWTELGGRRPLVVLRLQGLDLEFKPKDQRADETRYRSSRFSTGGDFSSASGPYSSEGGSSGQGPTPRTSSGGSERRPTGSGDVSSTVEATAVRNRRQRGRRGQGDGGGGAVIALPALLLRLLPLVRLELSDVLVRCGLSRGDLRVCAAGSDEAGGQPAKSTGSDSTPLPQWEGRLTSLTVAAWRRHSGSSSSNGDHHIGGHRGNTPGGDDGCTRPDDAADGGKAKWRGAVDQYLGGHASVLAAEAQGRGGGPATAAAVLASDGSPASGTSPQPNTSSDSPRLTRIQRKAFPAGPSISLVVGLVGMEFMVRRPPAIVSEVVLQQTAAERPVATAAPPRSVPEALPPLLTGRCEGLSLSATFGRGRRLGSKPGSLRAVTMEVKEIRVDCRTTAGSVTRPAGRVDGGTDSGDGFASADSPLAAALLSVLSAAAVHSMSSVPRKEGPGNKLGGLQKQPAEHWRQSQQTMKNEHPQTMQAHPHQEFTKHVAAWLGKLGVALPEKVSIRLAGIRAAAAVDAALVHDSNKPAVVAVAATASSPSASCPAAAVMASLQLVLGASSVEVGAPGGGTGPLLDASILLGPVAVLASAGGPAISAAAAPLYLGMPYLSVRAQAGAMAPPESIGHSLTPLRLRYNLSADVELPTCVMQVRPQSLLHRLAVADAVSGEGSGDSGSGVPHLPPAPQPSCYSLLLHGFSAKGGSSFSATSEDAALLALLRGEHGLKASNADARAASKSQVASGRLAPRTAPRSSTAVLRRLMQVKGSHSADPVHAQELAVAAVATDAAIATAAVHTAPAVADRGMSDGAPVDTAVEGGNTGAPMSRGAEDGGKPLLYAAAGNVADEALVQSAFPPVNGTTSGAPLPMPPANASAAPSASAEASQASQRRNLQDSPAAGVAKDAMLPYAAVVQAAAAVETGGTVQSGTGTASLLISFQSLEFYGSGSGAAAASSTTAPTPAPLVVTPVSAPGVGLAQAHGCRYDILLLHRTVLQLTLGGCAHPSGTPVVGIPATKTQTNTPPPEHQDELQLRTHVAVLDVAATIGRLDITLDPWKLSPLLIIAAHTKAAAAAASHAVVAMTAAASVAAAAAATAEAAAVKCRAAAAGGGSLLMSESLLANAADTFPSDVWSMDDVAAVRFPGGASAAKAYGGTPNEGNGRRLTLRRTMASCIKVCSVVMNCPAGARLALLADVPLDASFQAHSPDKPAAAPGSVAVLPTSLEVTLSSASAVAWPSAGITACSSMAEPSVAEAVVLGLAVAVVRATPALASQPPLSSNRQQILRIDRLKILTVKSSSQAAGADDAASSDLPVSPASAGFTASSPPMPMRKTDGDAGGRSSSTVAAASFIDAQRDLIRVEVAGTRGSIDIDLALAVLAAVQGLVDVAVAMRRERQLLMVPRAGASAREPVVVAAATEGVRRPSSCRRVQLLGELRANDIELNVLLGAAETVTVAVAEIRGSSNLAAVAVDAFSFRVNGRRFLDVEYLTVDAPEPVAQCISKSVMESAAAMALDSTAPMPPLQQPSPGSKGLPAAPRTTVASGDSRHVSKSSADMESLTTEALQQPLPPQFLQHQQQPGHRRHHRRHGSGILGSGGSAGITTVISSMSQTAAALPPLPPQRPSSSTLQSWSVLMRPPTWVTSAAIPLQPPGSGPTTAAAGAPALAAAAAALTATPGPTSNRSATPKSSMPWATGAARRRAARDRFFEAPTSETGAAAARGNHGGTDGNDGRANPGVVSVNVALYGATLTVSYDESAARVYVVVELWSRAVQQVLAPRVAHLKQSVRELRSMALNGRGLPANCGTIDNPGLVPGVGSTAAVATSSQHRDKAFVEILLDARRFSVVVQHQPLEAWLAVHGSALRATSTQRHLYERLMVGHVGSCAARGRRDVANAAAGASAAVVAATAAAVTAEGSELGAVGGTRLRYHRARAAGSHSGSSLSSSSSSSTDSSSDSSGSKSTDSGRDSDGIARGFDNFGRPGRRKARRSREKAAAAAEEAAAAAAAAAGESGGGGDAQDEWAQVMHDVAVTYIAACRAIQAAAAANAVQTGLGGGGGASAGTPQLAGCPGGALLHLTVEEAQAAVMVAPAGCNHGRKVAEGVISRVDAPASTGVTFERVVAVSLAAAASDLKACLAGCGGPSSPVFTCGQATVSGWIIRARQLAAPPRSVIALWPVGRFHDAPVSTPMKFCRPNMKTYTDLRIEADGVSAAFSTAMEPVLAQLTKAMKQRVVPPQPQLLQPNGQIRPQQQQQRHTSLAASATPLDSEGGTAPAQFTSASGLPPWDNIRYVWRGAMKVMIRGLNVVAGSSSLQLPITIYDPRVALSAATLDVKIISGRVDITATALAALGFERGPGRGPGEPLVTVPLISLPMLKTSLHSDFKQQSATPHAFPLLTEPPPEGALQDVVDVPGLMRSSSWSMALEISLPRNAVSHLLTHHSPSASSSAAAVSMGAPPPQQQQQLAGGGLTTRQRDQQQHLHQAITIGGLEGVARGYIGEMQVKFILALVTALASGAPVMTRGAWKRRTYFDPHRPQPPAGMCTATTSSPVATAVAGSSSGASAGGLGALLSRTDISFSADFFDIIHDAQDPDDPSDLVCLRARNLRYGNSFSYSKGSRCIMRSNGTTKTRVTSRPVMTALSVEAYDIRVFLPTSFVSGSSPGLAASAAVSAMTGPTVAPAAGLRRRHGGGGGSRGAAVSEVASTAGDPWDALDPASGPSFGAGLIATCECLLLRQQVAIPASGAIPGMVIAGLQPPESLQSQPPQSRPIRIVVQDVQVMCTTDAREAVIATTLHIIEAFSRLPGSAAARAAAASTSVLNASTANAFGAHLPMSEGMAPAPQHTHPCTEKGGGSGDWKSLSGASASSKPGGEDKTTSGLAASSVCGSREGRTAREQQEKGPLLQGQHRLTTVLPPRNSIPPNLRLGADVLAEPQIDPRVIADERALVVLLRQQNEARRAAARRRRLERSSASIASTVAALDPDADQAGSLDSDSEEEGVLGSGLDPTDTPDRDADVESESVPLAATAAAGGIQSTASQPTMQIMYEVEFVRVQVGLISEYGGSGSCLVLGADSALLRGGRAGAAGTASAAGTMAVSASPALKVLTFDVETLQAYAAHPDQPRDLGSSATAGGSGNPGAGTQVNATAGGARPSFSPLTDALAASAAMAVAAAATSGSGSGLQQRSSEAASAALTYGNAAPAPVAWLHVVNGQLVPYGTTPPDSRLATAGSATAVQGTADAATNATNANAANPSPEAPGPRVVMQKILNPFRIHLTSSRPWMPPPLAADATPSKQQHGLHGVQLQQPPQQAPQGRASADEGTGAGGVGVGGSSSGSNGLKLDIDVPAITGQMESWQFQLLLAVINETLASPIPKVVMLTRAPGGDPLPAVETEPAVKDAAIMLMSSKQRLRCLQHESLTLVNYLTHGSAGFHDPYPTLASAGAHPALQLPSAAAPLSHLSGTELPYTAMLFKPALQLPLVPRVDESIAASGAGASRGSVHAFPTAVPSAVLAQALLAPRPTGLNAMQMAALLRRNQELLLHWMLEQVSGAQEALEAVARVLVRLRSERMTALEAQQHQRRKQATAVAVRLGRFGWSLVNREGAPFVQAELKGLSFHHSLDRDHTGTTKIVMHSADMWELKQGTPGGGAAGTSGGGTGGSGTGAAAAAAGQGGSQQPPPLPSTAAGVAAGVGASTTANGSGGGSSGSSSSSSILSLWRPDSSSSWDDDPLLRMYLVHGGVDSQYVTYEHIEVYLHPLQVRLTYGLAHVLMDYFELRDEEREEGGGKEEDGVKVAGRKDKSKGTGSAKAVEFGAAAAAPGGSGAAGILGSPAKTGRSGGGGWFSRRSQSTIPDVSSLAAPVTVAAVAGGLGPGGGMQPLATAALHGALMEGGPRIVADARPNTSSEISVAAAATGATAAAGTSSVTPSQQRRQQPVQPGSVMNPYGGVGSVAAPLQLAAAAPASMPRESTRASESSHGRHSRVPSAVMEEHTAAASASATGSGSAAAGATPLATDGAAVAVAFPAATAIAVRYGPMFRRRSDGRSTMLINLDDTLVSTVPATAATPSQQQQTPATGRGGRADSGGNAGSASLGAAAGGGAGGSGRRARAPRRLIFRHVRFNRIAARLTYNGPRLSIGAAGGWGLVIDTRVYRNIVGGWKDILAKYKWDVIRSVIKNVAGIQSSKLKELRGVGGGAAPPSLLFGVASTTDGSLGTGGLLAAGLSLEDLDPDITYTVDGNALSAVAGSSAGGSGLGGGFGFAAGGKHSAAALLGGVKKRAAAFMSAGGAAGARLRQVASGKPTGRLAVSGSASQSSGPGAEGPLEQGLAVSTEDSQVEAKIALDTARLESADVLREMVRIDTAQEYERIKRAAAAAQARNTRLAALIGDVPASAGGSNSAGSIGGLAGGAGVRARAYRS